MSSPYRAPELLFGPRTYDAFAIDAWSLGVTFAEFFTSLRLQNDEDEDEDSILAFNPSESESGAEPRPPTPPPTPFVVPRGTRPGIPTGRWTRTSLFNGIRGEIGLAWSIFKVRGTPNQDTWPVRHILLRAICLHLTLTDHCAFALQPGLVQSFLTLPNAGKLSFVDVDAVELSSFLPNLPPSTSGISLDTRTHTPLPGPVLSPLDLIHRFLVYEPASRLRPSETLHNPWFTAEPGLVLPTDDRTEQPPWLTGRRAVRHTFTLEGKTRTLGDLLLLYVASKT